MAKKQTWKNTKNGQEVKLNKKQNYYGDDDAFIQNGNIVVNGKRIGQVVRGLQHGYHPSIEVRTANNKVWFEQDEEDLMVKIMLFAIANA